MKWFPVERTATCLLAVVLMAVASAAILTAQTPLQGQIALRPLARDDISAYKLPATTQLSGGLSTVGLGQPVYLEALVNKAIADSDIVGMTWELTSKPGGSSAALAESPLGMDVPTWEPADRLTSRVAGRTLLRPDVVGQYTVSAKITTASGETANPSVTITAGTYLGIKSCGLCHGGSGGIGKAQTWSQTGHASIFKEGINGVANDHYGANCLSCHTVGYDTDAKAVNGGFDDVAAQLKWTFPTALKASNWDALPDALKNLGNIQCENCHGPGSQHVASGGSRNHISVSLGSGVCGQCHAAMTHHFKNGEWNNSKHSVTTRAATGEGHEGCVGCHTGGGFIARAKGSARVSTDYSAINCQACHEPHGQTTPAKNKHLVRSASVKLQDGSEVTDAGMGTLCMNCHQSRRNAEVYTTTTPGSTHFGPHLGPQADMLQGTNAVTYGRTIPSSAHRSVVEDTCVHCHMQRVEEKAGAFTKAGGHTFMTRWSEGETNLLESCQKCHGEDITTFDFPLLDYDDDGVIDGVQTEVRHLLDKLSALLPPAGNPKSSLAIDASWTLPQLQAAYNWQFVKNDGSMGVHNMAYTVGVLKASIANLGGKK